MPRPALTAGHPWPFLGVPPTDELPPPVTLPPSDFAPLRTERLALRPLRPEDAAALHRLVNDWEVAKTLARVPFPYPRALADTWIASTWAQIAAGEAWHLAIIHGGDGAEQLAGCVALTLSRDGKSAELGYWLGRRFWGQGLAPEAAARLCRWALATLDIAVIRASALKDNPRSQAVLQRIGLRPAGEGVQTFLSRGGPLPVLLFQGGREEITGDAAPPPMLAELAAGLPGGLPGGLPVGLPGGLPVALPVGLPGGLPVELPADGKPVLLVAAVALIDPDGRVLLARRPEGKPLAGLWEFPGGKVKPGETPEAALIRELKEELDDRRRRRLPRPLHLRLPCLREIPPADAAVPVPALGWRGAGDGGAGAGLGASPQARRLRHAAGGQAAGGDAARLSVIYGHAIIR